MKHLMIVTACAAFMGISSSQAAEPATDLGRAVDSASNSTALMVNAADVIQQNCGQLAQQPQARPEGTPAEDLFFRCNEMVRNGNQVNGAGDTTNTLGLDATQLAQTMQQLTGEEQSSTGRLATETSNGQFANVGMRLDAIRRGARSTAGGLSLATHGIPLVGGSAGDAADGSGWGWFANGAFGFGDRDTSAREDGYDYDSYGGTIGADYQFPAGLVLGLAVGYAEFDIDFDRADSEAALTSTVAGGGSEVDGFSVSLYGIGDIGRFSVDGLITYGENDYRHQRLVRYAADDDASGRGVGLAIDRTMRGTTEGDHLALGVTGGTTFSLGEMDLLVNLAVNYLDLGIDGFAETDSAGGGLNLSYEDQSIKSLQSALGAQLTRPFSTANGVIVPFIRGEWRHEFENDSEIIVARYAVAQQLGINVPFNIPTDEPDQDWVELGVGLAFLFARNVQMFADYRASLGLRDTSANLVTMGIRGSF